MNKATTKTAAKKASVSKALVKVESDLPAYDDVPADQLQVLADVVWPVHEDDKSVRMAYEYCRARKLDPFKGVVHIVPVWDGKLRRMRDTVWPGIAEVRTTAARTGVYAGMDPIRYGENIEANIGLDNQPFEFPEWAEATVYRIVQGLRVKWTARVEWLETYATAKNNTAVPNRMWTKRRRGQLAKCVEAAALRMAFPEELGGILTADEMAGQVINMDDYEAGAFDPDKAPDEPPEPADDDEAGPEPYTFVDETGGVYEGLTRQDFVEQIAKVAKGLAKNPHELGVLGDNNGQMLARLQQEQADDHEVIIDLLNVVADEAEAEAEADDEPPSWNKYSTGTEALIASAEDESVLVAIEESEAYGRAETEAQVVFQHLARCIKKQRAKLAKGAKATKAKPPAKAKDPAPAMEDDDDESAAQPFDAAAFCKDVDIYTEKGNLSAKKWLPWFAETLPALTQADKPALIEHFQDAINHMQKRGGQAWDELNLILDRAAAS